MGKQEQHDKAQDATEVEGTPKRSKSEQLRHYKPNYESYQLGNGNLSMDNGDDVAQILRGASPETVMRAAEKLKGLEPGHLAERYKDRNNGAKRMNAGNVIRGCYKRGDKTVAEIRKVIKEANAEVMKAS
jgi:hypothetical protein